ncbi:orotidine-5'-phosphate decarboxylase [Rickettsiella endosymbiont of Litargus connexus]|jgi:uridine monophosphate synthetase|uniref:orotidine-5'-phosphate decarboxylase n=1 Tax=Rickettsiella endosymbiont of Litargus connexus TaxID=3066237 RepID=UPI0027F0C751|nr:orotidine-5'-phosphate decarboxylase [Gammaproteobacteria bacterium]MCH9754496.1 orotidine-5'-phosphate decarboxylase [Gammaproteobacteria bacterium]MDD4893090.1 orotidine-5'-phosphate decarboxylase [Candidatus Rickettsiella isopodorum]MDD5161915.1 orotidine-5'-phosphate decarboxylase [Candidatus Rickettsiella isopodorum]MDQ5899309.1 uridine monophosphate synthetase [Pseudomonadota bacterium]
MPKKIKKLSFVERASFCLNASARRLCQLIADKQTNLCLSADVTRASELLNLTDKVGTEICLLKTHVDILSDFTPDLIHQLKYLAQKHQFLIFEDRKFADIGYTVKQQYAGGIYHIADWADIVNAHTVPGPGVIQGLREIGLAKKHGLLLLAEMSSVGSLAKGSYTEASLAMAKEYPDFVMGFIAQHQLTENPGLIHMTPGIQSDSSGVDRLGQQYISPERAITQNGTDIIIVGRGIYQADKPTVKAQHYRELAWKAYLSCC